MSAANLRSLDTTALLVFHTLAEEGSVNGTARRLGMTQSAVSHALNRLRGIWRDPLFVHTGGRMQATQKALALAPGIAAALGELQGLLRREQGFDPKTDRRRFVVGMSDYAASVFLPALSARSADEMDRITFLVRHTSHAVGFDMLDRGAVECLIGSFPAAPKRMRQQTLFHDRFVCATAGGVPLATGALTLDRYLSAQHVHVSLAGEPLGLPDQFLARLGKRRRVALTLGHFLVLPHVLAASSLVATEPLSVIEPFVDKYGLSVREPPFETDSFAFTAVWLGRSDGDPGLAWLLSELRSIAQARAPDDGTAPARSRASGEGRGG